MTKRKFHSYAEYKDHPKHAFINMLGEKADDEDYYPFRAGSHYIHIACPEMDDSERFILVDSFMKVAKAATFNADTPPRLKKVEARFALNGNNCLIGVTAAGDRVFNCEGKTGSFSMTI